jgi:hypothetical protein
MQGGKVDNGSHFYKVSTIRGIVNSDGRYYRFQGDLEGAIEQSSK